MGIRAIGFLPCSEFNNDPSSFISKFRENLYQLGAFGFETWLCRVQSIRKPNSNDPTVIHLSFNDSPDSTIVTCKNSILAGDSALNKVISGLGLSKNSVFFKVEGYMAQLGDFKVRFGSATFKDKIVGILVDVEYLPISLLSIDFRPLFSSAFALMKLNQMKFQVPPIDPTAKFSQIHLGIQYNQLFEEQNFHPSN